MKKCEDFENKISLYIDEMLLNNEIEELLEHFDECESCYAYYKDLKNIREDLKKIPIEYPENLTESILDKIHENKDVQIVQYVPPKKNVFYALLAICASVALMVITSSFSDLFIKKFDDLIINPDVVYIEDFDENHTDDTLIAMASISNKDIRTIEENSEEFQISEIFNSPVILSEELEEIPTSINEFTINDILYDDYAFVFEFEGTKHIDDISGKVIHLNENKTYLEVENTLSSIENIIKTLEQYDYTLIESDLNNFSINQDALNGIFIIYQS